MVAVENQNELTFPAHILIICWRLMIKGPYITCILSYVVTAKGISGTIYMQYRIPRHLHVIRFFNFFLTDYFWNFFFFFFWNFFEVSIKRMIIPPWSGERIKLSYIKCSGEWYSNLITFLKEKIETVAFTSINNKNMWNNIWSYVRVIINSPAVWNTSMTSTLKCINCRLSWSKRYIFFFDLCRIRVSLLIKSISCPSHLKNQPKCQHPNRFVKRLKRTL